MKRTFFILSLIILGAASVFSQELITNYTNLAETSQEFKRISIRTVDTLDYLIEYSESKIRVSIIDSSLVNELYTKDDFPESSNLVNLYKIYWNAKGEHIVDRGVLFEFFTHEIRRRDLATGEIINSWSVDQDLTRLSRAQVFGDYCFLWGLDNSFIYLNIETGNLSSIQLTDQDPIVVNGMIYFEEDNKLLEVNPIDGSTTVLKNYVGPTFTSTYRGGEGEAILISNDFSENIEVFNGEEIIQYPWEEDVSFYITAIYASEKYMAIVWDESPELTLQVVDIENKTEVFREEYYAIDGHYAIDKNDLDNRHFIFQFHGIGRPTTLSFDSETGAIVDLSDTDYGEVRFSRNMSFKKDSSLYLIGRETDEVFGPNTLLGYELVSVNRSNLSSENISSSIAKGPFLVSPENTVRTLLISRDFSGHYLSVFNSKEDVKPIHKMVGYKNIGYEEIKYLAKWEDNVLLSTNGSL